MRASIFKVLPIVLVLAVTASAQTIKPTDSRMVPVQRAMTAPSALEDDPVTTSRDGRGVWFIEGGDLYDVYEAMGYAVATDRLFQMDLYRRSARGKMSELLGANFLGVDFLTTDIQARVVMYSDDELTEMFDALSEDGQTAVQAYVNGINRRIGEFYAGNWMAMPYEYWIASFLSVFQLGGGSILPTPFTINDILGWTAALQRRFDCEALETGQLDNLVLVQTLAAVYPNEYLAMFHDLRWLNDPAAQTMIPPPAGAKAAPGPVLPEFDVAAYPDMREAVDRIRSRLDYQEEVLKTFGLDVRLGSYAWAVSGDKTASGNPMVYSGPQMGFTVPSIVVEGSIRGGGLEVSGMTVPGIPGIIIGRTPHHAWSLQVGHAATQDWFLDAPQTAFLHHLETINPVGSDPVTIPIFRTHHGPIVDPFPFNPADPPQFVVSWAYAPWGHEAELVEATQIFARAESIEEFGEGAAMAVASQHVTYADRDGNIAYWMTGWDPIRMIGYPSPLPPFGDGTQEWTGNLRARAHDVNTEQGYYGGWNNKASIDYFTPPNNLWYNNGPAHRAQVVEDYLSTHDNLTFEEVRDLALNIATTDSFIASSATSRGGNTWNFVKDYFTAAVAANSSPDRDAAIDMISDWDGHFVAGGPAAWRTGTDRADAWVLQDAWTVEVLRLTFEDEFAMAGLDWEQVQPKALTFNVLLHALAGQSASLPNYYDWFQDKSGSGKPTTAEGIIVQALDNVIAEIGLGPYGATREEIVYGYSLLAALDPAYARLWTTPYSNRSTYAHVVEFGAEGPIRIESMFPLGESGGLYFNGTTAPDFDPHFFSLTPNYDPFSPRSFPLFE